MNSSVIFPCDQIKVVSDECKDLVARLLDKDPRKRNEYKVDEIAAHPWISMHNKVIDLDETILEADDATAYEEYQKKKGKQFNKAFVDSFLL